MAAVLSPGAKTLPHVGGPWSQGAGSLELSTPVPGGPLEDVLPPRLPAGVTGTPDDVRRRRRVFSDGPSCRVCPLVAWWGAPASLVLGVIGSTRVFLGGRVVVGGHLEGPQRPENGQVALSRSGRTNGKRVCRKLVAPPVEPFVSPRSICGRRFCVSVSGVLGRAAGPWWPVQGLLVPAGRPAGAVAAWGPSWRERHSPSCSSRGEPRRAPRPLVALTVPCHKG